MKKIFVISLALMGFAIDAWCCVGVWYDNHNNYLFSVFRRELMNSDLSSIDSLISEYRIPEDGQYSYQTVDGSSVTVMKDKQGAIERLHQFIYGEYYPPD